MFKEIKFNTDARDSIKKGVNILAEAVGSTLGPKGQCVIIASPDKSPRITKDGVSVAKAIELENQFEDTGAKLVREAAEKMLSEVGDSTTTSTVLAAFLINEADDLLKSGKSPYLLKKGMQKALDFVDEYINKVTIPIKDEDIIRIATISSNNDEEMGKLVADAFTKIGRDGVITVEESSNINTVVNIINGMQFDRGYLAPHFVTNTIKDECVLDKPYVLITDQKIHSLKEIRNILNPVVESHSSILLIAEDFDGEALENLKYNKLQGVLQCCAVKCPSFGEYRKAFMQDIAVLTGGQYISYDSGLDLDNITLDMLGQANKIIINKDKTTIIEGYGTKENINIRVFELKEELKRVEETPGLDGSFVIDFIKQRIAKLVSGIGCIYVGGTTELEMQERKDRIDDAICATRAAIESGVVLGGGVTYINAAEELMTLEDEFPSLKDGISLVVRALTEPFRKILSNAGYNNDEIADMAMQITDTCGFDARTDTFVNMYEQGIIDPAKAASTALKNAISVASLYLSTSCVITPKIYLNE